MLGRLSEFEGTCLTLLVRGLAPPPASIEEAFSRLPSERFAVTHLPPYNPSFGFIADRLLLSWAVRSARATAFVSTLYTQPFRVSKKYSVVRRVSVYSTYTISIGPFRRNTHIRNAVSRVWEKIRNAARLSC